MNKLIKGIKQENFENNLKEQNQKFLNNNNNINDKNSNKNSNNIYNSSTGYVSFKIKKNNTNYNNKENVDKIEEKNDKIINKYKKINERIDESIASSKFSLKINDDIHESEFNDVIFGLINYD